MNMNPAALVAALNGGDLANALIASTPGGIERQEAAGQRTLVQSAMLPKEISGATREQLNALGFKFGDDVDELFVTCELPSGWTKRGTDHSMHSDLLDEQGRKRAGIFYKAALYDRCADMLMEQRFHVDCYRKGSNETMRRVDVMDGDQVVKAFGEVKRDDYKAMDKLEQQARTWLSEQHPDWQSPLACW
jgi:hypothetical protein